MTTMDRIDHVGVAVTDLEKAIETYKDLGFEYLGREIVEEQKVETAFFRVGESKIELLGATDPASPIARFIEKNGHKGGIAHMAVHVTRLEEKLADMKAKGFQLIDELPKAGAHGMKIAFVHPKSTAGVLLELCEKAG